MRLNEFDNEKLAQYKTAAAADAKKADAEGDFARGHKRFKGINSATKKQFANDAKKSQLKEFAPGGDDGEGPDQEEILRRLAAQWWNGTEQQMAKAEHTLAAMGWEIGEDEGYDDGGVFVVRAGDEHGRSYLSWPHEDLEMNEVAPPGDKAERMVRHIKQGYARDGKLTPKEKGIAFATAWKAHNAGRVEEAGVAEGSKEKDPVWNKGTPMPKDYTCHCGIHVHPSVKKPGAIHASDCPYAKKQDKEQGVAEGTGQKPTITYKDYTLQYDYQTEDDDPEGYSTATTYYFDVFKDGKRVGEAEYFDYFGNLTIRINGKTKEFGFRHPLASQISQLVSSLPDEQKKDLSDPKFESQGVAEGLPQILRKVVPGHAKREIDKKMDAGKFGKTDADKDANFQRYKKIQDKLKEQGVSEGSIKDVEAKIRAHDQRKADREQEGDPYVAHELHSHNVIRKQLLDKRKRAQAAYHKKMDSEGADEGQQIDEVFADQGSGSTDRDNADYMKRRNAAKKAGYTGRETKAGTWRVFKDGNAVAAAGPFKSREEASAWIKKHKQGVTEMDKSEPSAGRDGGPRPGPDREAKPISAKKATKDAADMLNRAFQDSHKKKDVKEAQLDEFARGEGGYGPFKIYIGHHFTDQQFSTFGAAKEAVGILQNDDPALADGDWRIVNGTGKTVWEHVPAYDDMDESLAEDSLAAMRRLAGIVPQVPVVVANGPRQYRHMPTAVQPR